MASDPLTLSASLRSLFEQSAVVAWGRTTGDPTGLDGPDGTDGNQPRYTLLKNNIAHEIGVWEKQSSLLMNAKTSDSLNVGNVVFNGPRAGINQNGKKRPSRQEPP